MSRDIGQIVIYSVVACSIIAGLLSLNGKELAKRIKYFLIWVLIIFSVILAYSFKLDFLDAKNRIVGELFPDKAIQKDKYTIQVNRNIDGHFYIDIEMNGVVVKFMVDTGASDVALSTEDAEKIGINLEELVYNKKYYTANGIAYGASVSVDNVRVGNFVIHNMMASVSPGNSSSSLLGMSFLKRFRKFEIYEDKLILQYK